MSVSSHLIDLQDRIDQVAQNHHVDASRVQLIAVSKKQPIERIHDALRAEHWVYGENRVQEAQERWLDLRGDYPDLALHLIGPLQTNKVRDAVALFDVIHTLDREKLAVKLSDEMQKQARVLPCFVQVNTGGEHQKSGIGTSDLADFLNFTREECCFDVIGLMCIPPVDEPPALHFGLLKTLAERNGLKNLSIGMSGDFEKAIPFTIAGGMTYVRVGTGVFGDRS